MVECNLACKPPAPSHRLGNILLCLFLLNKPRPARVVLIIQGEENNEEKCMQIKTEQNIIMMYKVSGNWKNPIYCPNASLFLGFGYE